MRTFDLAPLYRSTVGFDRLFSLLDQTAGFESAPTYPPYNIERTGENPYRVTVARRFQLADHVEVKGATLENGLLHVDLVREIPETMKPRSVPINGSAKVIDTKKAA